MQIYALIAEIFSPRFTLRHVFQASCLPRKTNSSLSLFFRKIKIETRLRDNPFSFSLPFAPVCAKHFYPSHLRKT